jgi:triacylglycerol esterase/lipase EstA (alpha/beta hydrolase family)
VLDAGIDVCGQRLAQEVQQLVSSTPSLTTISFIGHSMGGLIARYAIGLLADPATGTVAGLQPQSYISIATPHLGCSSNHPDEVCFV